MMKTFKLITGSTMILFVLITFTNCGSSQKVEQTAPVKITNAYFQKWMAGTEGGGTGFKIYITTERNPDVLLNEAYFKGKKIKLTRDNNLYTGNYEYIENKRPNIVMSSDPMEEYGNPVPIIERKIPFDLKGNECIISYTKKGKQGYFKIKDLQEKDIIAYPSQPEE